MAVNEDKHGVPQAAQVLLAGLRAHQTKSYRLTWKGTKIPRGAKVDGSPITWTQHGVVYVDGPPEGRQVGYYTRTKEWAGEGGDEHEMLISTNWQRRGRIRTDRGIDSQRINYVTDRKLAKRVYADEPKANEELVDQFETIAEAV